MISNLKQSDDSRQTVVKADAPSVKIHCDATIAFPLLVAGALA
ncbi:deoxyhypusine synthase family protein [Candidatus Woesearchaeota archaeon]|nr:deoxyhypusine synthase family protein [Candidatus Woesearchaeota archaeon]